MTGLTVVAVDPGGRHTGVVARLDGRLLYGATVTRTSSMAGYVAEVVDTVRRGCDIAGDADRVLVAVEGLNPPSAAMRLGAISFAGMLDTATVLGAVLVSFPDVVVVSPGGNGSALLASYPAALVGSGEKVGTGQRRHMRSAWDVAGTAARCCRGTPESVKEEPS